VAANDVEEVAVTSAEAVTCPDVVCSTPESEIPATIASLPVEVNVPARVYVPVLAGKSELNI